MKLTDCKNRELFVSQVMSNVNICNKNNIWYQMDKCSDDEINEDVSENMMKQIYHSIRILVNRQVGNKIRQTIYETN